MLSRAGDASSSYFYTSSGAILELLLVRHHLFKSFLSHRCCWSGHWLSNANTSYGTTPGTTEVQVMDPIELTSCSPAAKCNLCASITAGRGGHLWVNPESGVEWQSVHKSRWSIEFGEFDGTGKWKYMCCVCEISRDLNSTQYPLSDIVILDSL